VRKSLVQGAFKELIEAEQQELALPEPPVSEEVPTVSTVDDLEHLAQDDGSHWVVSSESLRRGQLLEIEIELDADPVFAFNAAVSSMVEMMDENPELFGDHLEGVAAGEMMNRIIGRLLVGLVPLRCRIPGYRSIVLGDRELLVHHRLFDRIAEWSDIEGKEIFLVGVAEESLFWKDLRRVLFSHSSFTVMCRLARNGLQRNWSPVKLADVVTRALPKIGDQMDSMSTQMIEGFEIGAAAALEEEEPDVRMRAGMELYARAYAAHFSDEPFDLVPLGSLLNPEPGVDYEETEARRRLLEPLTGRLRQMFDQPEDLVLETTLRGGAMEEAGFDFGGSQQVVVDDVVAEALPSSRYLEADFVAIYW
jgi:hypothetical protein